MGKSMRVWGLLAVLGLGVSAATAVDKPNFIIIFTDDQGYGDLGCYGAKGFATPEIDRMAAEGMRFTDFTVADCVCSPSRAALLTGRYPARTGVTAVFFPWSDNGLPPEEVTIPEVLKAQGYTTGMVGKWHLGHREGLLPVDQGFDSYAGIPYSNDMSHDGRVAPSSNMVFNKGLTLADYQSYRGDKDDKEGYRKFKGEVPWVENAQVVEWPVDQRQLTKRYTDKAVAFIKQNQDKPFFLYLAHSMPHIPLYVSDAFAGKSENGLYGDVIQEIDWSVGQVLQALRDSGLDQKTLVVFTSDNGPWLTQGKNGGSAGPLRDGKTTTYEGGQRVPCIMWWPGMVPSGKTCDLHLSTLDLMPTIAGLAGTKPPQDRPIDGLDMRAVLAGRFDQAPVRDWFAYARQEAIRIGDWKYRKGPETAKGEKGDRAVQLFNLKDDVGERTNLADRYPERTAEMAKRLAEVNDELTSGKAKKE